MYDTYTYVLHTYELCSYMYTYIRVSGIRSREFPRNVLFIANNHRTPDSWHSATKNPGAAARPCQYFIVGSFSLLLLICFMSRQSEGRHTG